MESAQSEDQAEPTDSVKLPIIKQENIEEEVVQELMSMRSHHVLTLLKDRKKMMPQPAHTLSHAIQVR